MDIHSTLTKVVPDINNHLEYINWGGCGHFAYQLHKALALHGIASDIVLMHSHYNEHSVASMIINMEASDINDAYRKLFSGHYEGYCNPCFGHIGLRVDGKLYDSDGLLHVRAISEAIEADVLALALRTGKGWNSTFLDSNSGEGGGAVYKMKEFLTQALAGVVA